MVVMALGHARDFLGLKAFNATDLTTTTPPYFLTRWVTHFCAPGFMLLAGSAAFLMQKPRPELTRFLLARGLRLVFAELTIINFAWTFSFARPGFMVIWALGWSMVLLASLVWLPTRVPAVVAIGTIVLHNAFDGLRRPSRRRAGGRLRFHFRQRQRLGPERASPEEFTGDLPADSVGDGDGARLLPGADLPPGAGARTRSLLVLGVSCTVAFVMLRALNLYGDAIL